MKVYILNDSEDEYAKISDDFDKTLQYIGELITESFEGAKKKVKFTSEQFKWQWELIPIEETQESNRLLQLLFSRYGCTKKEKGKDCCECNFKCVECKNFYGDYDNSDFRCLAQHLESIDHIDITCMDCNLFQIISKYPDKDLPKLIQKKLT